MRDHENDKDGPIGWVWEVLDGNEDGKEKTQPMRVLSFERPDGRSISKSWGDDSAPTTYITAHTLLKRRPARDIRRSPRAVLSLHGFGRMPFSNTNTSFSSPFSSTTSIEVIQKINLNSSSIRLPLSNSEASDFGSEPPEGSSSNLVRPVSLIPVAYNTLFIIVLSQHLTPQERT